MTNPSRADILVQQALNLLAANEKDGARRMLEAALRIDSHHARARSLLDSVVPPPGASGGPLPSIAPQVAPVWVEPSAVPLPAPAPPPPAPSDTRSAWDTGAHPVISLDGPEPDDPLAMLAKDPLSAPPKRTPVPRSAGFTPAEGTSLLQGAKDLINLDDHSGALELLSKAEAFAPGHPEIRALREKSERTLLAMLESRLGALDRRPKVALKPDDVIWLSLDHRAGFVLAQIDGSIDFEDVFAVSGMSRLDTAKILVQLLDEGVIRPG